MNVTKEKHLWTQADLNKIFLALWTSDDLVFIPERYRVQFTFIFLLYCWTGARIGAFFTGGLRYMVGAFPTSRALSLICIPRTLIRGCVAPQPANERRYARSLNAG